MRALSVALLRALALGAASAVLAGCGMTFRLEMNPPADTQPAPEPKALHAGVYYSPRFSTEEMHRKNGPHTFVAPIGEASRKMFDGLFARVFQKTTVLANMSAEEIAAKGVDVVVAPTLVHFDFLLGMVPDSERYSVLYRVTLYGTNGVPAASWLVPGNAAQYRSMTWVGPHTAVAMTIEDDMIDARSRFQKEFDNNAGPALAALAKSRAAPPRPLSAAAVTLTAQRSTLPGVKPEDTQALREAGIVALELTAENRADKALVMRSSDMRLRTGDGRTLEPVTLSSALTVIERSPSSGGVAALFGPLVALAIDAARNVDLQAERDLQVQVGNRAIFNERSLSSGKAETGLVLFRLPEGVKSVRGATLSTWLVDPALANGVQVETVLAAD